MGHSRGAARTTPRRPSGLWPDPPTIASRFAQAGFAAPFARPVPDPNYRARLDFMGHDRVASATTPRTQPPAVPQAAGAVSVRQDAEIQP